MNININDNVSVRVNSKGCEIFNEYILGTQQPKIKEGSVIAMSLWELMFVFGKSVYMGKASPFIDNNIWLHPDELWWTNEP